ncbi:unnamed protein product [Ceratitis capitata]|uniref:(Mediterranean fruit fly) hypothetical protein n=1 Tax=Ceratitis capitata TaxID=7213 RepID=A0A811UGD7_CERCA|nr:unnamed protein product [Ceratitis capitata]
MQCSLAPTKQPPRTADTEFIYVSRCLKADGWLAGLLLSVQLLRVGIGFSHFCGLFGYTRSVQCFLLMFASVLSSLSADAERVERLFFFVYVLSVSAGDVVKINFIRARHVLLFFGDILLEVLW